MAAHLVEDDSAMLRKLATHTMRNVRLYFSNKVSVFYSLLGAIIAILIVVLFLRSSIVDDIVGASKGRVDRTGAGHVLDSWLAASAAVIASATTGLAAMRQFVDDRETKRWRDFLVAPISSWVLTLGYLLAALIVSVVMSTVVYALGLVYCGTGGVPLSTEGVLRGYGWLMLCAVAFTALMGFLVSLLKTIASFTAISTIVGVLFGFLAETYVHVGSLSASVANVLNSLPFAQSSTLVRNALCGPSLDALPAQAQRPTALSLGTVLEVGNRQVSSTLSAIVLAAMAVVFTAAACQTIALKVRTQ